MENLETKEAQKLKRHLALSSIRISKLKAKPLITKKRSSNSRISMLCNPRISSSTSNLTLNYSSLSPNLLVPNPCDNDIIEIEQQLNFFVAKLDFIHIDEKKFQTELKFYLEMLSRIQNYIRPYDYVINVIVKNLSKYITASIFKTDEDFKVQNEKLLNKLEALSLENIEYYKKNEELKKEVTLMKRTIVYSDTQRAVEVLLKELSAKSEYISKCNNEIQEYKQREYQILKRIERNDQTNLTFETGLSKRNACNRSQSIKVIPRISFPIDKPSDPNYINDIDKAASNSMLI